MGYSGGKSADLMEMWQTRCVFTSKAVDGKNLESLDEENLP